MLPGMMAEPSRWVEQDGNVVRWGNVIGGRVGQEGVFRFTSEDDAETFAEYAENGFPALSNEALRENDVPIPIERGMTK